jgi:hypothetical protein
MKTQVFGVTQDGELWHTVRGEQPYMNMRAVVGRRPWDGEVVDAACAVDDQGYLHVLVVTDCVDGVGRLWHTARAPNGSWTPKNADGTSFGNVGAVVGGESGNFKAVAAYSESPDLHVLAATDEGLWHTIRRPHNGVPIHVGGQWISPGGEPKKFEEEEWQGDAWGRQFLTLASAVGVE